MDNLVEESIETAIKGTVMVRGSYRSWFPRYADNLDKAIRLRSKAL